MSSIFEAVSRKSAAESWQIRTLQVGRISMLFTIVFMMSSRPSVASSSEIISAVQWDRLSSWAFSRLNIAKPRLKEWQVVVFMSVVILVPPDSDESGLAIWIVSS